MDEENFPLLPKSGDLPEQTRKDFYCEKHSVIYLRDALGRFVCPVCLVEATERLK